MAIFLYSGVLAVAVVQGPPAPADSVRAALWARVAADSTDAAAWLDIGRGYAQQASGYHSHRTAPDTAGVRAALDTANLAFGRAARWGAGTRTADSANVFRVYAWGERVYLVWEAAGSEAAATAWRALPETLRLPPVLEELGENLLRACPRQGVLLTAGDADTQAAWYMRFGRGLRPDLLVLPLARWRSDSAFRGRVRRELRLRGATLRTLAERRPVCASMAFERAPELEGLRWAKRPLVWVAGPHGGSDRVSPQDFVFAALKQAVDQHEAWGAPALALYRRAAGATSGLCGSLRTYGVRDEVGC
jgi:hypothetical protein